MALSSTVLCNNILKRAFDENIPVTPMKLQKLLYFVSCEYLHRTGNDLLSENFGVWQYGPVLPSVYDEFKSFRSNPITKFAKDANGDSYMYRENSSVLGSVIDSIWNSFKHRNGIELSKITHKDGSGWSTAFQDHRPTISRDDMGNDETYREFMC